MQKWKPFLPGDTIENGGVHILQVLARGKRMDETVYRIRCLNPACQEKGIMTHANIQQRRKNHRKSCAKCRQNDGVKKGARPQYLTDPKIIPPTWPVPPMLCDRPRPWDR